MSTWASGIFSKIEQRLEQQGKIISRGVLAKYAIELLQLNDAYQKCKVQLDELEQHCGVLMHQQEIYRSSLARLGAAAAMVNGADYYPYLHCLHRIRTHQRTQLDTQRLEAERVAQQLHGLLQAREEAEREIALRQRVLETTYNDVAQESELEQLRELQGGR